MSEKLHVQDQESFERDESENAKWPSILQNIIDAWNHDVHVNWNVLVFKSIKNPSDNVLIEDYQEGTDPTYLIVALENISERQADEIEKLWRNATKQKLKDIIWIL